MLSGAGEGFPGGWGRVLGQRGDERRLASPIYSSDPRQDRIRKPSQSARIFPTLSPGLSLATWRPAREY